MKGVDAAVATAPGKAELIPAHTNGMAGRDALPINGGAGLELVALDLCLDLMLTSHDSLPTKERSKMNSSLYRW